MKTETMTPRWVVENFLPDYENSHGSFLRDWNKKWGHDPSPANHDLWFERMFPEALSELLKAQRILCASVYEDGVNDLHYDYALCDRIEEAPIPEPKNRK